jgi:glycosyltransferase involved in cell wall biosynthesis
VRIVYDVSPLSHQRTGVGNYVRGALAGMVEAAAGEHELVAFAPASFAGRRAIEAALDGVPVTRCLPRMPFAHGVRTAWSKLGRPPAERFVGSFDVLHFSDWMYPPQRHGVRATMIHDLVPLRFPEWTQARTVRMHGAKYRNAARTCDIVFTNSRFTAADVEELLAVPAARIRVAPPGVDARFRPDGERTQLERPYVLTVATLEPRKNLGTLIEAHALLGPELALAVAGAAGWGEQPRLDRPGVVRLGYPADDELPALYRGAEVFVYPSRFEGFGIPVVEAMACGVPCVVSAHPSLDEACGDAAARVDAGSPEAIAGGIERAVRDRDALVERGLAHARRFSWVETGRIHLQGYAEAR